MTKEALKQEAMRYIDARADDMIDLGRTLQSMPELGFKEFKTAAFVKSRLEALGLSCRDGLAVTGVKARAQGRSHDFNLCIMSELDALYSPMHVKADPESGNAHACGHHAQMTAMLGAAAALVSGGIMPQLDGDITFFAVPAEELVDLEYRSELKKKGKIQFTNGKSELIRLGETDDLDMVLMQHSMISEKVAFQVNTSWNGAYAKIIQFLGKASHAGGAPEKGVNALYAATLALTAINSLRETFPEKDTIRVHPIITKGGDVVNIIPDDVRMETFVRANNFNSIIETSKKVNRALRGCAMAMGAEVKINELGGYMPMVPFEPLEMAFGEAAAEVVGAHRVSTERKHSTGSTDAGDLSTLVPLVHAYFGGWKGTGHGVDYDADDLVAAYVTPAKVFAVAAIDMLYDGARRAKEIKSRYIPTYANKESYMAACNTFTGSM